MSSFRIVKLPGSRASAALVAAAPPRPATPDASGQPAQLRSPAAHAALAGVALPASADADAFMAVFDAAASDAAAGRSYVGPGPVGVLSRAPVPGRPDLEMLRGRGFHGCSFIMTSRVKPPAPVLVRERSWAGEDELAEEAQGEAATVSVGVRPVR